MNKENGIGMKKSSEKMWFLWWDEWFLWRENLMCVRMDQMELCWMKVLVPI